MLLAIDIDNKFTNFAVFDGTNMICDFRISSDKNKSNDELRLAIKLLAEDQGISLDDIKDIIISSVVPELLVSYQEISRKITKKDPIIISPGVKTGINIKCENPRDVGTDRIIRAVGAANYFDGNLIIISAASITTIDFINDKKHFLGGAILPGISLLENSLSNQSAKLPQVEIKSMDKILGNTTSSAIQSGIYYGYINSIFGIVKQIFDEYNLKGDDTSVVVSGEFANLLKDNKYKVKFVQNLGLYGLNHIYKLNKK